MPGRSAIFGGLLSFTGTVVLAALIVVGVVVIPAAVEKGLAELARPPASESDEDFKDWQRGDDPDDQKSYQTYYLFDIDNVETNALGVPIGFTGGKPNYVEKGPYVYQVIDNKYDVSWSTNGEEITYKKWSSYIFDESQSVGPETDTATNFFFGFLAAINQVESPSTPGQDALLASITSVALGDTIDGLTEAMPLVYAMGVTQVVFAGFNISTCESDLVGTYVNGALALAGETPLTGAETTAVCGQLFGTDFVDPTQAGLYPANQSTSVWIPALGYLAMDGTSVDDTTLGFLVGDISSRYSITDTQSKYFASTLMGISKPQVKLGTTGNSTATDYDMAWHQMICLRALQGDTALTYDPTIAPADVEFGAFLDGTAYWSGFCDLTPAAAANLNGARTLLSAFMGRQPDGSPATSLRPQAAAAPGADEVPPSQWGAFELGVFAQTMAGGGAVAYSGEIDTTNSLALLLYIGNYQATVVVPGFTMTWATGVSGFLKTQSIREWLFYDVDPLLCPGGACLPAALFMTLNRNESTIEYDFNAGAVPVPHTYNTGVSDVKKTMLKVSVDGLKEVPSCNATGTLVYEGASDGVSWGANRLAEDDVQELHIYVSPRGPILLNYDSETEFKEIPTRRYRMSDFPVDPSNDVHTKGFLDISCRTAGAPVVASKPYFYQADDAATRANMGTYAQPDPEIHDSYADIEPRAGISLNLKGRLQFNLFIDPSRIDNFYGSLFSGMTAYYSPIAWVELSGEISDEDAATFVNTVAGAQTLATALAVVGGVVGGACICGGFALIAMGATKKSSSSKVGGGSEYEQEEGLVGDMNTANEVVPFDQDEK